MGKSIKHFIIISILFLLIVGATNTVSAADKVCTPQEFLDNLTAGTINDYDVVTITSGSADIKMNYTINASNVKIIGNGDVTFKATVYDCFFTVNKSNVLIKGINLKEFDVNSNGGAIKWIGDNGTLEDCNFTNCYADDDGGAIYWSGVNGTITNCSFTLCNSRFGGAIYWLGASGNITKSTFSNCSSASGGAVCWEGVYGDISSCNFTYCDATGSGGAITWLSIGYGGINGTVSDCNFINCTSLVSGGAIYWNAKNGTVSKCIFMNCTLTLRDDNSILCGYCIYWMGINGTVRDCIFSNWNITLDSTIEDNRMNSRGLVYWRGSGGNLINCNFTNFTFNMYVSYDTGKKSVSTIYGGLIYWNGKNGTVDDCNFINVSFIVNCSKTWRNDVNIEGSLIYWSGANGEISKTNFINCTVYANSYDKGYMYGGLIFWNGANGTCKISFCNFTNCNITFNHAAHGDLKGSIIQVEINTRNGQKLDYVIPGNLTIENCNFKNCSVNDSQATDYNSIICLYKSSNYQMGNILINNTFVDCFLTEHNQTIYNKANLTVYDGDGSIIYNDGTVLSLLTITVLNNKTIEMKMGDEIELSAMLTTGNCTVIGQEFNFTAEGKNITGNLIGTNYTAEYTLSTMGKEVVIGGNYANATNIMLKNAILVDKYPTNVTGKDITIPYNTQIIANVNITSAYTNITSGAVVIQINDTKNSTFTGNIVNGVANVDLGMLNSGIYNLTVFYTGNSTCKNATTNLILNVTKIDPTLSANITNITYGKNLTINLTTSTNMTGNLKIEVNNKVYEIPVNSTKFTIPDLLSAGKYVVAITYDGDNNFNNATIKYNVTVRKVNTQVNITLNTTVNYPDNVTVTITVESDDQKECKGNVTIKINNKAYGSPITLKDGKAICNITNLSVGAYEISVEFNSSDANYNNSSNKTFIDVVKGNATITINANTTTYGNNVTVAIVVTDKNGNRLDGNVSLSVDGTTIISSLKLDNGAVKYNLTNLDTKLHTITVNFNTTNANYTNSSNSTFVNVIRANSTLNITIATITYGENATIRVNVTDINGKALTEGNISFTVNGIPYTKEVDSSGKVNITVPNLEAGTYNITVKYNTTNGNYNNATKNATIIVNPANATINITITPVIYGNNVTVIVNITGIDGKALTEGNVSFTINGIPYTKEVDSSGKVNITVPNLEAGTYNITVKYNTTNRNYNNATKNATIIVNPANATINITIIPVTYGQNTTVQINVTGIHGEALTGNVSFTINGETYNATLKEGKANITTSILSAGNQNITVEYNSTERNYNNGKKNATIVVSQMNPTLNITIDKVTYGENATVNINVTGVSGDIPTGNVSFNISNKIYKATLENGVANIKVPSLNVGNITINVQYNSTNRNYNNTNKTAIITVNPANATMNITITPVNYGVNSTVQINVTGLSGVALSGNVSFKLGDVDYNATLDNTGKSSITTSKLDAGVYEITISFNTTNKNYNNITKKANITVNPVTPIVNITVAEIIFGDNATIQVNVTGVNGNIPSGNVTLKINGTWKSNTTLDNQGNAKFILSDLGAGGYLVEIIFNSTNTNYNNAINSTFFAINQGNATIDISVNDTIYGNNVTVLITVTDKDGKKLNGNVTISIDGRELNTMPLTDGEVLYNITESLSATEHMITVKFTNSSDVNYTDSSNSTEFNVVKGNTTVNINAETTTYGDNLTLIITVTGVIGKTPTGNLTITVDGTTISDHPDLINGKAYWNITGLSAGTHSIHVTYNGNENYTTISNNTNIFVNKATPEVNITVTEITYGENATVQINVTGVNSSYVAGNVTITVDNVPIPQPIELVNGAVTWNSTILSAGKHNITVTYNGNKNYYNKTDMASVFVKAYTPAVNITVDNITYGENATVNITVIGSESIPVGTVTLYINGTMYNSTSLNDNGKAVFVVGLNAGRYFIEVNYTSTNRNYTDSSNTTVIKVEKADPTFDIGNITYGDGEITIDANSSASGNITVTVGEMNQTLDIVNGSANVNITEWNLPAGNYTANITYSGDDNYNNITITLDFTIDKANATFEIDNITYGDEEIVININSTASGNVTVTINGTTKTIPIINGSATLNITEWNLPAGNHTAIIDYAGDKNYTETIKEVNFTIEKSKTHIDITINKTSDDSVMITLNLTDDKGNIISGNVTVNITSNSGYEYLKTYFVNGPTSFNLNQLPEGNYNITATYNATEDYESSFMNNSFEITYAPTAYYLDASNVVKYYMNSTQYHVRLTDNHGSPVANKTILVTLNSSRWAKPVSYNITTNASGVAKLDINLIAGKYSIIATFINATPEINNITVLEVTFVLTADDVIKYFMNGTHYTVKVTSQFGDIIPNEVVNVKVYSTRWLKPAVYTIKTNSSGIAVLPINLLSGVYTITATVGKTIKYNNIAVYPTLTADSITKTLKQSANLKAKLVDGQGNPVADKEVKFTVKTKTYTFKTNSEGIATLPIHLGLGTWSFLISSDNAQTRATVKVIK